MVAIEDQVERSGVVCAIRNRRHDGLKFVRVATASRRAPVRSDEARRTMRQASLLIVMSSPGSVNGLARPVPYVGTPASRVLIRYAVRVMRSALGVAHPASEVRNRRARAIDAAAVEPTLLTLPRSVSRSNAPPCSTATARCRNTRADVAHCRTQTMQKQRIEDHGSSMTVARARARENANAEDAALWRWFAALLDERRIRWCHSGRGWLVSVDHRHVATGTQFDQAMRIAKENVESSGTRRLDAASKSDGSRRKIHLVK
ncbi:hypothetical protein [Burkholderia cepacia]|uniref:hypothetical protein n=1 Tax=Burkholderia cepacia TaxID=292 RepID=UPI001E4E1B60|nr:hypothetical protein [Burkholderia cepacia]